MAFLVANRHDDAPRGSAMRAAVELSNAEAAYALSHPLTAAGCATATTTSQAKTVNTLTFTVNGVLKSKGATDNFWTLAGVVVAASSFQKYLLLIDGAGAATVQEGVQSTVSAAAVAWTNVANYSQWAPILTVLGAGKIVAGVLTVATAAATTFTPGTTLLGAAGITATFIDGLDQSILPLCANEIGLVVGNF